MKSAFRRHEALLAIRFIRDEGKLYYDHNEKHYISWNGKTFLKHKEELDTEIYKTITTSEVISWKKALKIIREVSDYWSGWSESLNIPNETN